MKNIYTLYDVVAKECGPLWQAKNHEVAIRQAQNLVETQKITRPEDFHLYCVGNICEESMDIVANREFIVYNPLN